MERPGSVGRMQGWVVGAAMVLQGVLLGACGFDEREPEDIFFRMTGETGTQVQVVYSTRFVAGVNEVNVTEVRLVRSDTVVQTLPLDTVVSVAADHRFFVEVLPLENDTLDVGVQIDVDARNLYTNQGVVHLEEPFRYVYLFNHQLTRTVDVVF